MVCKGKVLLIFTNNEQITGYEDNHRSTKVQWARQRYQDDIKYWLLTKTTGVIATVTGFGIPHMQQSPPVYSGGKVSLFAVLQAHCSEL